MGILVMAMGEDANLNSNAAAPRNFPANKEHLKG